MPRTTTYKQVCGVWTQENTLKQRTIEYVQTYI